MHRWLWSHSCEVNCCNVFKFSWWLIAACHSCLQAVPSRSRKRRARRPQLRCDSRIRPGNQSSSQSEIREKSTWPWWTSWLQLLLFFSMPFWIFAPTQVYCSFRLFSTLGLREALHQFGLAGLRVMLRSWDQLPELLGVTVGWTRLSSHPDIPEMWESPPWQRLSLQEIPSEPSPHNELKARSTPPCNISVGSRCLYYLVLKL